MIPGKHFYMIRHGQSVANANEYASGRMDILLTDQGRAEAFQARVLIENLRIRPKVIWHSHLARAKDTAEIINEKMQLPMKMSPLIAEQDYGEWQGKDWSTFRPLMAEGKDPPGGESHQDFFERANKGLEEVLENTPEPALIVSHGGVFKAFGKKFEIPLRGVQNCVVHEFVPVQEQNSSWDVWVHVHEDGRIMKRRFES